MLPFWLVITYDLSPLYIHILISPLVVLGPWRFTDFNLLNNLLITETILFHSEMSISCSI